MLSSEAATSNEKLLQSQTTSVETTLSTTRTDRRSPINTASDRAGVVTGAVIGGFLFVVIVIVIVLVCIKKTQISPENPVNSKGALSNSNIEMNEKLRDTKDERTHNVP